MNLTSLKSHIQATLPGLELREGESLSRHCSFRIGGPAALMAFPSSGEELAALGLLLKEKGQKPFIFNKHRISGLRVRLLNFILRNQLREIHELH